MNGSASTQNIPLLRITLHPFWSSPFAWTCWKGNPMDKVTLPRRMAEVGKDEGLKYFNKPGVATILWVRKADAERSNNLLYHTLFRLLAFSGMRKGEALALTWNDLDFTNETVTINKTLTRGLENKLIIQTPKKRLLVNVPGFRPYHPVDADNVAQTAGNGLWSLDSIPWVVSSWFSRTPKRINDTNKTR